MHPLRSSPGLRTSAGFTLVEMMFVVILIGILSAMSLSSYGAYVERNRASQAVNRLITDVAYARMLAVRSGRETRIQPFEGGTRYEIQSNTGNGWERTRSTRLSDEFRGVTFQGDGIRFDPRGLRADAGDVALRRGTTDYTILVSAAGRVIVSN
jgi:prepilin-type N-terminal cleavage/methylation domain-containing protein